MTELYELTASEIARLIASGKATAEECVDSVIERIHAVERKVHAYITLDEEGARQKARQIDQRIKEKKPVGRLAGIVVAIKDNMCVQGTRTTCSSHMLENFIPPYDATVVERIKRADGIVIGKTNMDEFAMGTSTENSHFGPTYNPWDLTRVPGGSSGGSAAAVACGEAILALGSDTGGSVRCPASFCSIVGLKPTYGLVSRYGLIAYANSLEQIGPLAKTVEDCATLLTVIAGHDERDCTTANLGVKDYKSHLKKPILKVRVGVVKELFGEGTHEGVTKTVMRGVDTLEDITYGCEEISLPSLEYSLPAYYLIAMSEASSNLARYDGLRYGYRAPDESLEWDDTYSKTRKRGFGAEVRRRVILGSFALSAGYYDRYYVKALQVRTLVRRDFERAFSRFDVLVGPTMPLPPFKVGEKIKDPLELYMCDVDTVPVNLAGLPAISTPCGFFEGLPIGMQIIGRPFAEELILRVANAFEKSSRLEATSPPLR